MFTGLIKDIGTIEKITSNSEGKEITISSPKLMDEIAIDDSVSTNGVCLTATDVALKTFKVQAVHVTLDKTNIGQLKVGSSVNLELALRPQDRLGGHFVQGHVNGVGILKKVQKRGDNYEVWYQLPQNLMKYMVNEGSIAIDGISLTLARVQGNQVMTSIIPHTWDHTILQHKKIGSSVNIEVDMIAKYLESLIGKSH